jgi:hypothetical protein
MKEITKVLRRDRRLLRERYLLLARYDHHLPPAIYQRVKEIETAIAWHHHYYQQAIEGDDR